MESQRYIVEKWTSNNFTWNIIDTQENKVVGMRLSESAAYMLAEYFNQKKSNQTQGEKP